MLSDEQVAQFQVLYKNRFGKEITKEEALEKGSKLIRLMQLIYKPMTEMEYKKIQERRRQLGENLKN